MGIFERKRVLRSCTCSNRALVTAGVKHTLTNSRGELVTMVASSGVVFPQLLKQDVIADGVHDTEEQCEEILRIF